MANISWWRTNFGEDEIRRIADSIRHEHISQGTVTAEFERSLAELFGVPYVVATTNGSMAILMALMAIGLKPGDEVIVPNRTWIATAHAPMLLGARVILVDVEKDRPIIDAAQIEGRITPRTKAIIPVHLNGRSAAMREINAIAEKHGLCVIEDAAQAMASRNSDGFLGTQSHMGCFSLSVAKIISTGQGGYITTKDEALFRKLQSIRTHGVSDPINAVWRELGFNFRFTDILASVGLAQIERLRERIEKVKAIYARYAAVMPELSFLKFLPVNLEAGEIPIYIEVLCPERDRLVEFLAQRGIQTRPFYPNLNVAPYFENAGNFPRSEVYGKQGLFLPSGPTQSPENIEKVLDALREFRKEL
jgi:perosamine synthetase